MKTSTILSLISGKSKFECHQIFTVQKYNTPPQKLLQHIGYKIW